MYYANISEYYTQKKNYKKALEFFRKSEAINDSLFNERLTSKISDLEVKHAIENKNIENELLRKENRIQQLEINKHYVLGVLTICVLLFIIWLLVARYRSKLKDNELLFLKNKVVSKHQQELVEAMGRLQESEDNLRSANATKDKMFSLIAHDLRGSIGNISNGLRMLLNDEDLELTEEDKAEFLQTLFNSADNSYELLENLLLWARNQSHTITVNREIIDLNQLISNNVELLIELAKIKSINLFSDSDDEVHVYADRNMLNTIIRNLISNAIKFTNRGGRVEIRTDVEEDFVKVSVIDNGIGMTSNQIMNIYNGKTTDGTDREKGSGLGLMLCRDFLENNDGKLSVESEVGKGSVFSFTVPRESLSSEKFSEILGEEAFISSTNG
jgi:signal transduction histidine kinase